MDHVPGIEEMRQLASKLLADRYPDAAFAFAAGSLIRGEGTASSDLDLVVMYDHLPYARRESYEYGGRPVEAFVHDPETLQYFMVEEDCKSGYPIMPHMVVSGVVIPGPTEMSDYLQKHAKSLLDNGPAPLHEKELAWMRYLITDALDDLQTARSPAERVATAAGLYDRLANVYLRLRGRWSGHGKWIPRLLKKADERFAGRFVAAFDATLCTGDLRGLEEVAKEALSPVGGLFTFAEGHRADAKPEWRRPLPERAGELSVPEGSA